jgi:hypothetical protein
MMRRKHTTGAPRSKHEHGERPASNKEEHVRGLLEDYFPEAA